MCHAASWSQAKDVGYAVICRGAMKGASRRRLASLPSPLPYPLARSTRACGTRLDAWLSRPHTHTHTSTLADVVTRLWMTDLRAYGILADCDAV